MENRFQDALQNAWDNISLHDNSTQESLIAMAEEYTDLLGRHAAICKADTTNIKLLTAEMEANNRLLERNIALYDRQLYLQLALYLSIILNIILIIIAI